MIEARIGKGTNGAVMMELFSSNNSLFIFEFNLISARLIFRPSGP